MIWRVRVTDIVLRLYICPPIQEEGDTGILIPEGSVVQGGGSILQQGHTERQKDRLRLRIHRQTGQPTLFCTRLYPKTIKRCMYAWMYVSMDV